MGGVCQIWAPIYYGTVKVYVANIPNILVRGTPYNF